MSSSMPAHAHMLARAAGELEGISASMSNRAADAAVPTTGVTPAAADVVSALVAAQFAAHAHAYQAVTRQVAAAQALLADTLGISIGHHRGTEANALPSGADGHDDVMHAAHVSGPLLAAAAAWDGLAANLHSSAASYASLIGKLTEKYWQDPVSAAMAAGATQHVTWLSSVAGQAKHAATQAEHAADWLADRLFRSA